MGHAATTSRTSVLETAAATLQAVEDVRSLMNTVAVEQGELKARIAALETRERELGAALELNLAAIRAKADTSTVSMLITGVEREVDRAHDMAVNAHGALYVIRRPLLGRLFWLVTGR